MDFSQERKQCVIGIAALWHFFDENQAKLLHALLPEYTKLGFATKASLKIIDYAFHKLGFPFLDATCDTPNVPSHKVARAIGMHKTKARENRFFLQDL